MFISNLMNFNACSFFSSSSSLAYGTNVCLNLIVFYLFAFFFQFHFTLHIITATCASFTSFHWFYFPKKKTNENYKMSSNINIVDILINFDSYLFNVLIAFYFVSFGGKNVSKKITCQSLYSALFTIFISHTMYTSIYDRWRICINLQKKKDDRKAFHWHTHQIKFIAFIFDLKYGRFFALKNSKQISKCLWTGTTV